MSGVAEFVFGIRLRELREAAGFSQEQLGQRAGLSAKAIGLIERGERRNPYPHTVRTLADALGLDDRERADWTASLRGSGTAEEAAAPSLAGAVPVPATALVGRQRERAELETLLRDTGTRLLTITGPGGVGKTRLAVEVVREIAPGFGVASTFVALAPVGEPGLLLPTVAHAVGLTGTQGADALTAVQRFLGDRPYLLCLDNMEHLVTAAADIAELLSRCPGLVVLVTSRAPLRVSGEREYPLEPLGLPIANRRVHPEEVVASPAGRLLVERARAVAPRFEVTEHNATAVADICRHLAGIPLALELAAARARFLDPDDLLARLDQAIEAGGARDLPPRQRTMRSTLDWSHDLLEPRERQVFARMAVCAGSVPLETVEAVAADAPGGSPVVESVGALVEQSMVTVERRPGGLRYGLLEPVRQYALEHLRRDGDETTARRAHARHHLRLAAEAEPEIVDRDQVTWLDRLEAENDELRSAIAWAAEAGEPDLAADLAWSLRMYWVMRGRTTEARLLLQRSVEHSRGRLVGLPRARTLAALATVSYGSADASLVEVADEVVALARDVGASNEEAFGHGMAGLGLMRVGDLPAARVRLEESLRTYEALGEGWGAAAIRAYLGALDLRVGDVRSAVAWATKVLEHSRGRDRLTAHDALQVLAAVDQAAGDVEQARSRLREALVLTHELGTHVHAAYCIEGLAALAAASSEHERATVLFGAAEGVLEKVGAPRYAITDHDERHQAALRAREALGERRWTQAWDVGRRLSLSEAVAHALDTVDTRSCV